jgi:predicted NUDIX family phosphoesterase
MPLDESVLCLPAGHVEAVMDFTGFRSFDETEFSKLLDPTQFSFQPRTTCEHDPAFKQLIPYLVLKHGETLFTYRRGASGTEKRLQAKWSVGIGGHISEDDARGGTDPYRTGMLRELQEEVRLNQPYTEHVLGFIYDPRTFVGSVHLGIVHLLELTSPEVESNEEALAESGFLGFVELKRKFDELETWSQFVVEELKLTVAHASGS